MRIVINDANILIDLFNLDLVEVFFGLQDLDLKTTDFVFEELLEDQKVVVEKFIQNSTLKIVESTEDDLTSIYQILSTTSGLSVEDCSVWYYAKKSSGILLTGDGKLRKLSSADGVEVRGILYIFDQLLVSRLMSFDLAIEKLNQLYLINERLPIEAKKQRLDCWARSEHFA
jgi:predicted nucleic acid-binding protein